MCEFQQNIIGGGGWGGGGELPEWSKVNYLESDEVGVDQKKSREEERGNKHKQNTHK